MIERSAGVIAWLTGLSAAGKSTLAMHAARRLAGRMPVEVLDGDELRQTLSRGLGFSRADREEQAARIGYVSRLLARHGVVVLVAAITPYAATRAQQRALASHHGVRYLEIFVDAPMSVLLERDPKGLYARAQRGEIPAFTGISDPYEPPDAPELVIRTDTTGAEEGADALVRVIVAARDGATGTA